MQIPNHLKLLLTSLPLITICQCYLNKPSSYKNPRDYDSCYLKLDYANLRFGNNVLNTLDDSSVAYEKQQQQDNLVYAGNGYNYELNCHVNDPKMRSGDKYYVIDLIVYGPNQRVAKAWREQFTTISLFTTRSLFLHKNLSFYWLGENNIVCAVSKYNSLINKFSHICQNNLTVNVTERQKVPIKLLKPDFNDQDEDTEPTAGYFPSPKFNIRTTIISSLDNTATTLPSPTTDSTTDTQLASSNLSANAMEFKRTELNLTNLISPGFKKINVMQPVYIALIFLVIFLVSIGTIVYLTYAQKGHEPKGEYNPVKVIVNESNSSQDGKSSDENHSTFECSQNSSTYSSSSVYNDRMTIRKL